MPTGAVKSELAQVVEGHIEPQAAPEIVPLLLKSPHLCMRGLFYPS